MLAQVIRCLDEYQENYRRPGLAALELSGLYALFPEEGAVDTVESRWNEPYPNADRKGVYLIFGRTGMLLYVGKASMGASLGGRLGTYFAGKKECRLLFTDWTERPTYVATIAVPQGMSFEAPSLEEYLIKSLKPCDNNLGISGRVPVGGIVELEEPAPGQGLETSEPPSFTVPLGHGVYTYSAPGLPMCSMCGQRPVIFYCLNHHDAVCLECVAKHDHAGECAYVPAFRAPKSTEGQTLTAKVPVAAKRTSVLGID